MYLNKPLLIEQKSLSISLKDYLQINAFLDGWCWSKRSKFKLYQEDTKKSRG